MLRYTPESDRLRLARTSVATESVNQSLIKESDRLRLTRASVATESVNQSLIKELDRVRGSALASTRTYRDLEPDDMRWNRHAIPSHV